MTDVETKADETVMRFSSGYVTEPCGGVFMLAQEYSEKLTDSITLKVPRDCTFVAMGGSGDKHMAMQYTVWHGKALESMIATELTCTNKVAGKGRLNVSAGDLVAVYARRDGGFQKDDFVSATIAVE